MLPFFPTIPSHKSSTTTQSPNFFFSFLSHSVARSSWTRVTKNTLFLFSCPWCPSSFPCPFFPSYLVNSFFFSISFLSSFLSHHVQYFLLPTSSCRMSCVTTLLYLQLLLTPPPSSYRTSPTTKQTNRLYSRQLSISHFKKNKKVFLFLGCVLNAKNATTNTASAVAVPNFCEEEGRNGYPFDATNDRSWAVVFFLFFLGGVGHPG